MVYYDTPRVMTILGPDGINEFLDEMQVVGTGYLSGLFAGPDEPQAPNSWDGENSH